MPAIDRRWDLTVDCPFDDQNAAWQWDALEKLKFEGDVPNSWLARLPWTSFANNENDRTIEFEISRPTEGVASDKAAVEVYAKATSPVANQSQVLYE